MPMSVDIILSRLSFQISALSIVNGDEGNDQFANEQNADGSYHASGVEFDPTAVHDKSLDLNEDDLFRYVQIMQVFFCECRKAFQYEVA